MTIFSVFFSRHVHWKLACFCSFIIVGSTPGRMDPLPNQTQHQWHSKNCVHESIRFGKLSFSSHARRETPRASSFSSHVCCLRIVFISKLRGSDQAASILRMLKSALGAHKSDAASGTLTRSAKWIMDSKWSGFFVICTLIKGKGVFLDRATEMILILFIAVCGLG